MYVMSESRSSPCALGLGTTLDQNKPVKSAERTLALFELFSTEQRAMTVTEIASALLIPQPSASVLVRSFVSLGYLERTEGRRAYYPTLRLMLLTSWMNNRHESASQIPKLIAQVAQLTGESTVLAMRNSIYSQYVLVRRGREPERMHVESGMLYPLACSSTGWCLMSRLSDDEIGKIVRRTQVEAASKYWRETAINAIERVAEFRRDGFAFSAGQTESGLGGIAVLMPATTSSAQFSVAVGGPLQRIAQKQRLILDALNELTGTYRAYG